MTLLDAALPAGLEATSAVWDGANVEIFGGRWCPSTSWQYCDEAIIFDPASGSVTVTSASLPTPRAFMSAFWDGSSAYVLGGQTIDSNGRSYSSLDDIVRMNGPNVAVLRDFVWPASGRIAQNMTQHMKNEHGTRAEDIANAVGTPVTAAYDGDVVVVRQSLGTAKPSPACVAILAGFGLSPPTDYVPDRYVILQHAGGYYSEYHHLDWIEPSIASGQLTHVRRGDQIGAMGATGCVTGPHVHFVVGKAVVTNGPPPIADELWLAPDPRGDSDGCGCQDGAHVTQGTRTGGAYDGLGGP